MLANLGDRAMKTRPTVNYLSVKQSGVTLVELLVSMVIGLFIVSGVISVMAQGKDKFLLEQELSLIQENARFAMDELAYEVRMAGYNGCSNEATVTNALNAVDDDDWMFDARGIRGYLTEDANKLPQFSGAGKNVLDETHVVILTRGEMDDSTRVAKHTPSAATIKLTAAKTYNKGDIVVIVSPNCDNAGIFQVTGPNSTGTSSQLNHAKNAAGVSPGNCAKALTGGYTCKNPPAPNVNGSAYPDGSSIMRFRSAAYFVRESTITGRPTLYRQTLVNNSNTATTEAQELLSGVEDMQILYGYKSTGTGSPDIFVDAGNIPMVDGEKDWDGVLSVRIVLTLVSSRQVFDPDPSANPPDDGFLRKNVIISGKIRNRG